MRITGTGDVGIGTNAPSARLHLRQTSDNQSSGMRVTNSLGSGSVRLWMDGSGNTRIDSGDDSDIAINENENGKLGLGRSPTANRLEVAGAASKNVAGDWLANSDRRIKTDVRGIEAAIKTLDLVRVCSFRYTDDYRAAHPGIDDRRYLNVIAQEFADVFPDHVKSSGEKLPDGSEILQVDPWPLTIYSVAAIQELHAKYNAETAKLKSEISDLRSQISDHESRDRAQAAVIDDLSQRLVQLEARINAATAAGGR
jgi:hypothetical protein